MNDEKRRSHMRSLLFVFRDKRISYYERWNDKMNMIKNILVAMGVLLLGYILLIVAIPALAIGASVIAIFGNIALYVMGAIAVIWLIVKIIKSCID